MKCFGKPVWRYLYTRMGVLKNGTLFIRQPVWIFKDTYDSRNFDSVMILITLFWTHCSYFDIAFGQTDTGGW